MSIASLYNRTGYVTLFDEDKEIDEFRGLNFKFSFEYMSNASTGKEAKGTVGILGLSGDRIHDLTTFCNGTNEEQYGALTGKEKRVAVYAGYSPMGGEDSGKPILTMPIVGAWPTPPPNMWLNISGFNGAVGRTGVYDARLQSCVRKIPLMEYIEYVADRIGAKLDWPEPRGKMIRAFKSWGIVGTEQEIVKYINESLVEIGVYIDRSPDDPNTKILHVIEFDLSGEEYKWRAKRKMFLENEATAVASASKSGPTISAETGMIGFPKVTFGNGKAGQIEVTTLLRMDIGIYDNFTVKSDFIKFANATFTCTKIKHTGEFRGNDWYTTFTGQPSDVVKGK